MKALLCYSEKDFRIEEIEKPRVSGDGMLIEMLYCGLCGSDIIKIFDSSSRKPAVYGHEVVGRVVEPGSNMNEFQLGDIVVASHHIPCGTCHFCLHGNHSMCRQFKETNIEPGGFSEFIKLSGLHVKNTVLKVPDGFDLLKIIFTEPLACCIRAMERIEKLPGDMISVIGTGAIGILFIQLAKLGNMKVVAIDMDRGRLELAREMGADYTIDPSAEKPVEKIRDITSTGIDAAILTVTSKYTLADALSYIRPGGSINIFGMAEKEGIIPVDMQKIYKNELTLKSTYSSTPETLAGAHRLITSGKIDLTPLISVPIPLADFKKGLDLMLEKKIYKAFYKLH